MSDSSGVPHPPYDELRAAAGDEQAHQAALDALHATLSEPNPSPESVRTSVARVQTIPVFEARIANWFDSPRVQQWLYALSETGL